MSCSDCAKAGHERWHGYWHGCQQCIDRQLARGEWVHTETALQELPEAEREPRRQAMVSEWHRVHPNARVG